MEQEVIVGTLRDDIYTKTTLSRSAKPGTWWFADLEYRDLEEAPFEEDLVLSIGLRMWL